VLGNNRREGKETSQHKTRMMHDGMMHHTLAIPLSSHELCTSSARRITPHVKKEARATARKTREDAADSAIVRMRFVLWHCCKAKDTAQAQVHT
jgi:hypothetical protein